MSGPVILAVVDPRGRVLMQQRDEHALPHPDRWGLPDEGAGLQVSADSLISLGRTTYYCEPCGGEDDYELIVSYTTLSDADLDVASGEGPRMVFVDRAEVFELDLHPAAAMQLPDLFDSREYRQLFDNPPSRRFASVALVDRNGALLFQERDEHPVLDPEKWGFPGGHVEEAESFAGGAARELAEETSVVLDPADLVLFEEARVDHRDVVGSWDRMRLFAAATECGDDDVECHEGRRMIFLDPGTVRGLPLTRSASQLVPRFLASGLYARLAP
jgi:ADP-ribose pyrophosphatase YjhB (NUDIX family)